MQKSIKISNLKIFFEKKFVHNSMNSSSKKKVNIVPNETMWPPSKKARSKLQGKKYSLLEDSNEFQLPEGFRFVSNNIQEHFKPIISDLNEYNVAKYMRTVKVRFEQDGAFSVSAIKTPGKFASEIKNIVRGKQRGFKRSFNGSKSEIGDIIDGTFKNAFENSTYMTTASQKRKEHPIFNTQIVGSCDGIYQNRPIEVKSIENLDQLAIEHTLQNNWLQLAAYNWLYEEPPIIVIVSRDELDIIVIEPECDLIEEAMTEWDSWNIHVPNINAIINNYDTNSSILVK